MKVEGILADIFLSYARENLTKAKVLAVALENSGWSVFSDSALLAGQYFHDEIEQEIKKAGCMIVAWSAASRNSVWVNGEATLGERRKILVPIKFELVDPPINFLSIHTENFATWNGDIHSDEFNNLKRAVARLVGSKSGSKITVSNPTVSGTPKLGTSGLNTSGISKQTFIEPEMMIIPVGRFQMGGDFNDEEKPVHTVIFAKPFFIAKNLVTFDQYDLFAQATKRQLPSDNSWGRVQRPVINVSWEDATAYASWLSKLSGKSYRLPSEAEWEYAARSNTTTEYYWDGQGEAKDFAWLDDNSDSKTHPVAEKKPNAFGLYDMSGNVWEWVQDCWNDNYQNAPIDGSAWESLSCSCRVLRGGSWYNEQDLLRSAYRDRFLPGIRNNDIGFRLAQD